MRQDEQTSLETEAQVARSTEVLGPVAASTPGLTIGRLQGRLQVTVPASTQILEISYSANDPVAARQVADAVARAYLDNRTRRFDETNAVRIDRVETQTLSVVTDLRAATQGAQVGSAANRDFQSELAAALRNELVSLRAQRTALENSESPPGAVISPASAPAQAGELNTIVVPAGGGLAGLALGCLLALVLERLRGVVHSSSEVQAMGLPVVAAVPRLGRLSRLLRKDNSEAVDTTVRRLRAAILDLEPRPDVIAVAPAGAGGSAAEVSEAVAESFAKAGHRVVLVRADADSAPGGIGMQDGLAQALLHHRLNVMDLLQPSVEPLLSLLPHGQSTDQSREFVVADRVRGLLSPLIEAGHLVVIQSPGLDSAEGEAIVGAADWGLVVVTLGLTRPSEVERVTTEARTRGAILAAMVVDRRDITRRARQTAIAAEGSDDSDSAETQNGAVKRDPLARRGG